MVIKILRSLLHLLALLASLALIFDLTVIENFKIPMILALLVYICAGLLYSFIRSLIILSFPKKTGILLVFGFIAYQFFSKNFIMKDEGQISLFIIYSSGIFALSNLIHILLGTSISISGRNLDLSGFKKYFRRNSWFSIAVFIVLIAINFLLTDKGVKDNLTRLSAILLAFSPLIDKDFVRQIKNRIKTSKTGEVQDIGIENIGKLGRIRNFVFLKDKIISSGIYQITDSDYRSTVRVTTAIHTARMLADEWNQKFARLFVMDEFEKIEIKYRLVDKNENGVTVIDDDANMYHLGNATYLTDKIKQDDKANLFLLKNDIVMAKFRINEKILSEKIEFMNQLDYFGNTLMLHHGKIQDLGHDYTIIFDKIYTDVNIQKQAQILKELERKAPTALFVSRLPNQIVNSLCFYVTSNLDEKSHGAKIVISPEKLLELPLRLEFAKKIQSFFRYMLLLALFFQLLSGASALLLINSLILIFALNMGMGVFTELISFLMIRRLTQFPSQPANPANNHQAA